MTGRSPSVPKSKKSERGGRHEVPKLSRRRIGSYLEARDGQFAGEDLAKGSLARVRAIPERRRAGGLIGRVGDAAGPECQSSYPRKECSSTARR